MSAIFPPAILARHPPPLLVPRSLQYAPHSQTIQISSVVCVRDKREEKKERKEMMASRRIRKGVLVKLEESKRHLVTDSG